MKIYLIRHGKTAGNKSGRYIGKTDEPLCGEGKKELEGRIRLPVPEAVYVSPMLRCRQTAAILYPGLLQNIAEDFRECDFGAFENKNYQELSQNADYQAWIDSGGSLPFPGGESREVFQERCVAAFQRVLADAAEKNLREIACVVHGGTIMSVLEKLALPHRDYYDYQVKNGCGYLVEWKETERMVDFTLSVCYAIL